jgi:hypothetical protein
MIYVSYHRSNKTITPAGKQLKLQTTEHTEIH